MSNKQQTFLTYGMPDDGQEMTFSTSGCDICNDGLANDIWEIKTVEFTVSQPHKRVSENDIDICHDCLCKEHNGEG